MDVTKRASDRHAGAGDGAGRGVPVPGPGERRRPSRTVVAVVAAALLLSAVGIAAWIARSALDRPLSVAPDRAELVALDGRLTAIQSAIRPIAESFTAEPNNSLIDVSAYREKIASVRRLVDSTNDLTVSSPDALEVRDLIITGGSQVLAGMDTALDALVSDDASATAPAIVRIDDGLASLQDARDKLDALLGKKSST